MSRPFITREQAAASAAAAADLLGLARDLAAERRRGNANRAAKATRQAGEVATIALRYAEHVAGYREAQISPDGLLLVLVAAKAAGFDRKAGAWRVLVEYPIDPRTFAFKTRPDGRRFLHNAGAHGIAHAVAMLGLPPATLPARQVEAFAFQEMGGLNL